MMKSLVTLYHLLCLLTHSGNDASEIQDSDHIESTTIYAKLKKEIMSLTNHGHAVLVSSCWERFKKICALHQVPVPYYFKARRKFFLNKLCSIVPNS